MKLKAKFRWLLLIGVLILGTACAAPASIETTAPPAQPGEDLRAVFFDVGQADSILISSGEEHMLVDAGNLGQDELLTAYLREYGADKLAYIVATHPHADHIGAMAAVIKALDIGEILMPDIVSTTTVFENLLTAIEEKNLQITVPQPGDTFMLGQAFVEVLAPNGSDYQNMNDYSIVLRISLGEISFLLTGDAEALSEAEQLAAGRNLKANVLKVGHHGSASSSTEPYLAAVKPTYAIISCGEDNSYGHPHAEVLARLSNTQIYQTAKQGTIEIITDGKQITVNSSKAAASPLAADKQNAYIGNRNSRVFHLSTCANLPAAHNQTALASRQQALDAGYRPCQNCQP